MTKVAQGTRLLLVEDEASLRNTLKLNFELEGYSVTTASTGGEALERWRGARFDVAVLDVMLPEVDGFTLRETLRLEGDNTPVLFLTARNSPEDRLKGLRLGDDHLAKPFDLHELLQRVRNLLERTRQEPAQALPGKLEFSGNTLWLDSYEARGQDGATRPLGKREVKLLRLLLEKEGEVVSREEILQKVWGYDVFPTTRTIDNFIVAFRKSFEPDPKHPRHFISVRGVGYKFQR